MQKKNAIQSTRNSSAAMLTGEIAWNKATSRKKKKKRNKEERIREERKRRGKEKREP